MLLNWVRTTGIKVLGLTLQLLGAAVLVVTLVRTDGALYAKILGGVAAGSLVGVAIAGSLASLFPGSWIGKHVGTIAVIGSFLMVLAMIAAVIVELFVGGGG